MTRGRRITRTAKQPEFINIDEMFPEIEAYFRHQEDILAVYLFGSYGTEFQTPMSDVDIALLFDQVSVPSVDRVLEIEDEIRQIAGEEDINVLCLNNASLVLQFNVIKTGRIVYEKHRDRVSDFHERVFKLYGDFVVDYEQVCRDFDEAPREVYQK